MELVQGESFRICWWRDFPDLNDSWVLGPLDFFEDLSWSELVNLNKLDGCQWAMKLPRDLGRRSRPEFWEYRSWSCARCLSCSSCEIIYCKSFSRLYWWSCDGFSTESLADVVIDSTYGLWRTPIYRELPKQRWFQLVKHSFSAHESANSILYTGIKNKIKIPLYEPQLPCI